MIPEFNVGGVLPPFLGAGPGAAAAEQSPYGANMLELVQRFGTSPERGALLSGLLRLRARLREIGIEHGLQWIDGSFVENAEITKGRPPGDIDVVTLLRRPQNHVDEDKWRAFVLEHGSTTFNPAHTKAKYSCEAFYVDLFADPESTARQIAYWFGLFSHQRDTFRWKGMVEIRLEEDDSAATAELEGMAQSW